MRAAALKDWTRVSTLKGSIRMTDLSAGDLSAVERAITSNLAPSGGDSGGLDCSDTSRLVRRFLAGDEDVERRAAVRSHLVRCAGCREQYHSSVETMAQLAHAPRAYHEGLSRAPRHFDGIRTKGRAKSVRSPRPTLVKLILPAFGLYAAFVMSSHTQSDGEVRLRALSGMVCLGQRTLNARDPAATLSRSQSGSTDASSRARIESQDALLVVEPLTAFAIERVNPSRLRLFEGTILFEGSLFVATRAGVLEASHGSGVLRVSPDGVEVAVAHGVVAFHDSHGRTVVQPHDELRLPLPGSAVLPE